MIKLKKIDNSEKKGKIPFYEEIGSGDLGLIHVYTGHGKGKTTSSIGLAIRATGHGYRTCMIQFLKGGSYTGEYVAASDVFKQIEMHQVGKSCIKLDTQLKLASFEPEKRNGDFVRNSKFCGDCRYCFSIDEDEKLASQEGLNLAIKKAKSGDYDIIILDEIFGVINQGLVEINSVLKLITEKHKDTELVLTGRDAPEEVINAADYVSEVRKVKHPFDKGIEARKGIEY